MSQHKIKAAAIAVNRVAPREALANAALTLQDLRALRQQLFDKKPDPIRDKELFDKWVTVTSNVDFAVTVLATAINKGISEIHAQTVSELEQKTEKLKNTVASLQNTTEIVNTIAKSLDLVTRIITLFA